MYVVQFSRSVVSDSLQPQNNLKVMGKLEEQQKQRLYLLYSNSQPFNISLHYCIILFLSIMSLCVCKLIIISFYEPPEYKLDVLLYPL